MVEKLIQLNIKVKPSTAAALRKYAFETTGQMRGVSDVAEQAIIEYLEKRGIIIDVHSQNENPLEALVLA